MSDNTLTEHPCGSVTLTDARKMVCLEAAWELESLADILPGLVPNTSESGPAHYAVRGISDRIRRLSRIFMCGLGDEVHPLADMERTVFGAATRDAA